MLPNDIVYLNGSYLPASDAKISLFDRGYLMADSVYEVSAVVNGKLIDNANHLQRLRRSMQEIQMNLELSDSAIIAIQEEIIARNNLQFGEVYLQVSRGAGIRSFLIDPNLKPTLSLFPMHLNPLELSLQSLHIQTQADIRWLRRDIKTTQLLAQSLGRTIAQQNGFNDVWFIDADGFITEGSAFNAYIVKDGVIITRAASYDILNGITRQMMLKLASEKNLRLEERAFTPEEAYSADEAFITSCADWATAVVSIDKHTIGSGRRGPIAATLHECYKTALL